MQPITVLATDLKFPEGPAFTSDGTVWCVEQEGESLFYRRPDGTTGRVHVGGRPNGLFVDDLDRLWFCDSGQQAIRCLNQPDAEPETIIDQVDGESLNWPNDLLLDRDGNLLFTCPGPSDDDSNGYVCVCTPVGEVRKIAEGLFYPNGLTFLPNGHTLLIAETHRKRIWAGRWDPTTLQWINPTVWAETGPDGHGPDGIKLGPDNRIYAAIYGAGCIRVYHPNSSFLDAIHLPGQNPTNCAFDPTDNLGLVVTEGEKGQLLSVG